VSGESQDFGSYLSVSLLESVIYRKGVQKVTRCVSKIVITVEAQTLQHVVGSWPVLFNESKLLRAEKLNSM
jgi:hypothetical protein